MARKAFYSFHFNLDHWRASQVRNMGVVEGNTELSDNDWEAVKKKGDAAVEKWIEDQMHGKSCIIVLVGAETASRKWVKHEISKGWIDKKGVLGIRIHSLLNHNQQSGTYGANPFDGFNIGPNRMSSIVNLWNPPGYDSKAVYASIKSNIANLVEEAIAIRAKY